ncbi:MAG TPA: glycosyltransferase, partial [Solirubrobacteraceae bacterium]
AQVHARVAVGSASAFAQARALARRLRPAGGSVELLVADPWLRRAEVVEHDNVVVRRFPLARGEGVAARDALRDHLRRAAGAYDVVHAHSVRVLSAVESVAPDRLVVSLHGLPSTALVGVLEHLRHRDGDGVVLRAARVVCESGWEAEAVARALGVSRGRIEVVTPPLDVEAVRQAQPFATESSVVAALGGLRRHSGLERAIGALPGLPTRFELVALDPAHGRRWVRALAADLGVSHRVRFPAPGDAVRRRWLRTARVTTALSRTGTPVGLLLEAAAAGALLVASDVPAHREVSDRLPPGTVHVVSTRASPLAVADAVLAQSRRRAALNGVRLPSADDVVSQTIAIYTAVDEAARSRNGRAPLAPAGR